ncbi:MAG: thiamine-phosphate kinase [Rhodocyclaceae bacterium]|nr:thiamine-phosphate kinase [Rhodocyclaceae bacterium]
MGEFELIRRHFVRPTRHTELGVGDDAALLRPRPGMELAISTDMLVSGTHFLPDVEPESLGWKALAVNVSDLAAMGAEPRWALLAASLPEADEAWVASFAQGFFACAEAFGVDVIGGDTTRGPLNLAPTILGEVPRGQALRRSGAHPGDEIWVSGAPGLAALGLAHLQGRTVLKQSSACIAALTRPQPRVALGLALRGIASAAIDVSDGLFADLGHILEESGCGAEIEDAALPWAPVLAATDDPELARTCLVAGGDDYELAFTAPPGKQADILALAQHLSLPLTRIGRIVPVGALKLLDDLGAQMAFGCTGYDHFG